MATYIWVSDYRSPGVLTLNLAEVHLTNLTFGDTAMPIATWAISCGHCGREVAQRSSPYVRYIDAKPEIPKEAGDEQTYDVDGIITHMPTHEEPNGLDWELASL
jgi:hypothetical protein